MKLTGRIRSFDKYSVVLETNNQEQLIFKHAISTVVTLKSANVHPAASQAAAQGTGATGGQQVAAASHSEPTEA